MKNYEQMNIFIGGLDVKMITLPALTNWFLKCMDQDHGIVPVYLEMQTQV